MSFSTEFNWGGISTVVTTGLEGTSPQLQPVRLHRPVLPVQPVQLQPVQVVRQVPVHRPVQRQQDNYERYTF